MPTVLRGKAPDPVIGKHHTPRRIVNSAQMKRFYFGRMVNGGPVSASRDNGEDCDAIVPVGIPRRSPNLIFRRTVWTKRRTSSASSRSLPQPGRARYGRRCPGTGGRGPSSLRLKVSHISLCIFEVIEKPFRPAVSRAASTRWHRLSDAVPASTGVVGAAPSELSPELPGAVLSETVPPAEPPEAVAKAPASRRLSSRCGPPGIRSSGLRSGW
ncbi:hypothetical protein SAMN03159407_3371 [Rhizobium sp. NFR12]|nr:hypothetical protein SAMN03159407_3371 [Rhizobium sp. NFR12]